MATLTKDVIERVSGHVGCIDALHWLMTCKAFYEVYNQESFWRTQYEHLFENDQTFIDALKLIPYIDEKRWGTALFLQSFIDKDSWQSTFKSRYGYHLLLKQVPDAITETEQCEVYASEPDSDSESNQKNEEVEEEEEEEPFTTVVHAWRKARKHYHKELEGETPRKAFDIKRFAMHFQFSGAYELGELYRESAKLKRYNYDSDSDDYDGFSLFDDGDGSFAAATIADVVPPSNNINNNKTKSTKKEKDTVTMTAEKLARIAEIERRVEELNKQRQEEEIKFTQTSKKHRAYFIELCAKVYSAILHLTHQELKENNNKYNPKIDRVFAIDPYHFTLQVHPHAHLKLLLKSGKFSYNNRNKYLEQWQGDLNEDLSNWIGLAGQLFAFQSGIPELPPIMLLSMDNVEWNPDHRKWGFYSNYAGEIFMWGKLLEMVEKGIDLNDSEFINLSPKDRFSILQQ